MEENYKATSRNGHELKDMYNPETNTLDMIHRAYKAMFEQNERFRAALM